MKQVIFFTPHFLPHLGGVEKHVSAISKTLHARKWAVEIVTLQYDETESLLEHLPYAAVKRIPISEQQSKNSIWKWIKNYFQTVSSDATIHVHDVGWWLFFQLWFNKKNNIFITFHGWEGKYPVRWQAKLHRKIISLLMNGSIHVGSFIQHYYWDKPNYVVFGGVDLPVKQEIVPISMPLKIAFLGRLESENNINMYLDLLAKLALLNIKVDILWIGDGTYRPFCEKWGKVTGMVTDIRKYTAGAHLVFASSYLSMLEAQAQGKIVCAFYNNPLKKDYLNSYPASNVLLLADNTESMASQIKDIVANSDKYQYLSKKGAAFAQTQTWSAVTNMYEQLWKKV